jgi:hypothetical protein
MLNLTITQKDKTHKISIENTKTVGDLKSQLFTLSN